MDIFAKILEFLGSSLGPALRALLQTLLNDWENAAKKTATPIDDIIVGIVKKLVGI
jgi:hypothetical protein